MLGVVTLLLQRIKAEKALTDRLEALESRVTGLLRDLRDAQDEATHAHERITSLTGRVTGGTRKKKASQDAPGDANGGGPYPRYSVEWWDAEAAKHGIPRR